MYCLLPVKSTTMGTPCWIEKDKYHMLLQTKKQSKDLLDAIELFSFYTEAYEELKEWCMHTDTNVEYLMSNKHTAERKCRGLLLELKTYFLQMGPKLSRKYGESSTVYKLYTKARRDAARTDATFAFVMDLKEYANHCNEIVHSFMAPNDKNYLQPCCIPTMLLPDFNGWTKASLQYISTATGNIDLLEVFETIHDIVKKIQEQLIAHLLSTNDLKDRLLALRAFMDEHFTKENCYCFHLAHMVYQNGKDAPKAAFYQNKLNVKFNALPIDWKMFYELTDLLRG